MEAAALWKLMEANLPALRASARSVWGHMLDKSRLGSLHSPEDILHESMLKLTSNPSYLHYDVTGDGLRKLMYVAMKCYVYDLLRKMDNKRCVSMEREVRGSYAVDGAPLTLTDTVEGYSLSPDEVLEKQEQYDNLYLALDALGNKSPSSAIVLSYSLEVEESHTPLAENHKQMAQALGIPENRYKQSRHQGIKRLRRDYLHLLK